MSTQDSQSELEHILNEYYDDRFMVDYTYKESTEKAKQAIEAYVTTRVKEAERLARINELNNELELLLKEYEYSQEYGVKISANRIEQSIKALTTTTNGKEDQ